MKIIISTDGSDFSREAIEKSCQIVVEPQKTRIKIVSVYETIEPIDVIDAPLEYSQKLADLAHKQASEAADEAAATILGHFPQIDLSVHVSKGAPDEILIETAREWKADLIVIGSHGRGFWERMLLGSITDSLVHHAPCSVLVVRKIAGKE